MIGSAVAAALPRVSVWSADAGCAITIDPSAMAPAARTMPRTASLVIAPPTLRRIRAGCIDIYRLRLRDAGTNQEAPMFVTGPRIFSSYDGMTIPYEEAIARALTIVPVA